MNRYMRLENYPKDSVPQEGRLLTKIDGNASEFHLVALFHNPGIRKGEAITDLGSFIDNDIMVPGREARWLWLTFRSEGSTTTITVDW